MNTNTQYWYNCLSEILPDHGINIDGDTLEKLASDIADAAEMQGEATGEIYIGVGGKSELEKVLEETAKRMRQIVIEHENKMKKEKEKKTALYRRMLHKIKELEKQIES